MKNSSELEQVRAQIRECFTKLNEHFDSLNFIEISNLTIAYNRAQGKHIQLAGSKYKEYSFEYLASEC